jgi:hypothetical protein
MIETVDISPVDRIPMVLLGFETLKVNFVFGYIFMAEEFKTENIPEVHQRVIQVAL